jgi:hypothetical protein
VKERRDAPERRPSSCHPSRPSRLGHLCLLHHRRRSRYDEESSRGVAHTLPVPGAFDARNPTPVLRNWVREPLVRPAAAVVLLPVRGWCYVKVEGVGYSEETSQQRKERKEDRRRREGRGTHTTNTRDSRHGRSRWEDAIREDEVSIPC